jgi:thioredoxin reductase
VTSARIAVAPDATLPTRLKDVLSRRFGTDYRIIACDSPASGLDQLRELSQAGVFYGADMPQARTMGNLDVVVLGGGNSAGQAAAHLNDGGARVTAVVRGPTPASSMSDYLIRGDLRQPYHPNLPQHQISCPIRTIGTSLRLR